MCYWQNCQSLMARGAFEPLVRQSKLSEEKLLLSEVQFLICQVQCLKVYYQMNRVEAAEHGNKRAGAQGNYDRIFDQAKLRVRAWEKAHLGARRPYEQ